MISIKDWSIASFLRQNWSIISRQDSLWIKWCYTFLLKMFLDPKDSCRFFLDLRKTVQISNVARPFVKYIIGNGANTFVWFDNWLPQGPLFYFFWASDCGFQH